jgi:hypothetical protein
LDTESVTFTVTDSVSATDSTILQIYVSPLLQIGYRDAVGSVNSLSATFDEGLPLTAGSTLVIAYTDANTIPPTVTDNLGNSYSSVFHQSYHDFAGGTSYFGISVGLAVPNGGLVATITLNFAGPSSYPTLRISEFAGPISTGDPIPHVSARRDDVSDVWSTGSYGPVLHPSLVVAQGLNNKLGPGRMDPPWQWALYQGGYLITLPTPSVEAYFTAINYAPENANRAGSVAGLVVLRLS